MTRKQAERQEAIEKLREMLKPGDALYTVLRKVSRTGMSRRVDVYKLGDGEPLYLTGLVARAIDATLQGEGLKMDGCGMDMGFEVVYRLGWALWPKGFDTAGYHKDGREYWRNEPMSYEKDGGYALKQRWL